MRLRRGSVQAGRCAGPAATAAVLGLAVGASPSAWAQWPVAPGPDEQVSVYPVRDQTRARVARNADGAYVVVWQSMGHDDGGYGIYARRYSAAGVAQGGEIHVNTYLGYHQTNPVVAIDADGDFVVAWMSDRQDGSGEGVYARRFAASGAPQGAEFRVDTHTAGDQEYPRVAMAADGSFVVVWERYTPDASLYDVYAQRYGADGAAQGETFRVNTFTTDFQGAASVAMDAGGDFVVAWSSDGQDGRGSRIKVQRYAASGAPLGGELYLPTTDHNYLRDAPSVAMDADGDFFVVWQSRPSGGPSQDGSGAAVVGRRYAASGTPLGAEFLINTATSGAQAAPTVAMDAGGAAVVAWSSAGQDGDGYGIYARRYDASGARQGGEFRVNTHTTGHQLSPSVAMDAAGNVVAAWHSAGQDVHGYGVFAYRYAPAHATAELRGAEGWRMLAAPTAGATVGDLLGPVWTQGFPGADVAAGASNVYRYDERAAGPAEAGYVPPASAAAAMESGRGYLAYVYADADQDGAPDAFPRTLTVSGDAPAGAVALPVSYTDTADDDTADGWNLVGNPYPETIDWDLAVRADVSAALYAYDPALPGYRVWNGVAGDLAGGLVAPVQGFWVKAMDTDASGAVAPSVLVSPAALAPGSGVFYGRTGESAASASPVLALSLVRGHGGYGREGRAFVSFEAGAVAGLDAADAYRLDPAAADWTALFTRASDGSALAVQALGLDGGHHAVPLEVAALEGGVPAGGAFVLSWAPSALPAGWSAWLVDAATGARVDLTVEGAYPFTVDVPAARPGDDAAGTGAPALPTPRVFGSAPAGLMAGRFTVVVDAAVSAGEAGAEAALSLGVSPNPVRSGGRVRYGVPAAGPVRVVAYDVLGRVAAVLAEGAVAAGAHEVAWDTSALAPGVYLVRLEAGGHALVQRVTVAR